MGFKDLWRKITSSSEEKNQQPVVESREDNELLESVGFVNRMIASVRSLFVRGEVELNDQGPTLAIDDMQELEEENEEVAAVANAVSAEVGEIEITVEDFGAYLYSLRGLIEDFLSEIRGELDFNHRQPGVRTAWMKIVFFVACRGFNAEVAHALMMRDGVGWGMYDDEARVFINSNPTWVEDDERMEQLEIISDFLSKLSAINDPVVEKEMMMPGSLMALDIPEREVIDKLVRCIRYYLPDADSDVSFECYDSVTCLEQVSVDALSDLLDKVDCANLRSISLNRGVLNLDLAEKIAGLEGVRLETLKIERRGGADAIDSDALAVLLESEVLSELKSLDLSRAGLKEEHFQVLFNSPLVEGLGFLSFKGNKMGQGEVTALLESDYFAGLDSLSLKGCLLRESGLEVLASSAKVQNLRELDLGACLLEDAGFAVWADSFMFENLKVLKVAGNGITDEGVAVLADSPYFNGLEELDLSWNGITAEGVARLANAQRLGALKVLNLNVCAIGDEGLRSLVESPLFAQLEELHCDNCHLSDEGVKFFAEAAKKSGLKVLNLNRNDIVSEGVIALTENAGKFSQLEVLEVSSTFNNQTGVAREGMNDEALIALINSPLADQLKVLVANHSSITDEGAKALAESQMFRRLEQLELLFHSIGPEGVAALNAVIEKGEVDFSLFSVR